MTTVIKNGTVYQNDHLINALNVLIDGQKKIKAIGTDPRRGRNN